MRFLAAGILLAVHFPLAGDLCAFIRPYAAQAGLRTATDAVSHWAAAGALVMLEVIVLPTGRDLYAGYMADRLNRVAG